MKMVVLHKGLAPMAGSALPTEISATRPAVLAMSTSAEMLFFFHYQLN